MACQHSNGHFILADHLRLYLKVGDFATTPLQACIVARTTSPTYNLAFAIHKRLPCYTSTGYTFSSPIGQGPERFDRRASSRKVHHVNCHADMPLSSLAPSAPLIPTQQATPGSTRPPLQTRRPVPRSPSIPRRVRCPTGQSGRLSCARL